jgi:hypothetical protein
MFLVLTASSDTYITNKIVDDKFRAIDANVGLAPTLDLFKLYAENSIENEENPIELSRLLIKFDLANLKNLTSSLNLNDSSFKAVLQLYNIENQQTTPINFNVVLFPLSKSFDEGLGRDVRKFQDLDRANFVTSSFAFGATQTWNLTGSNAKGTLNDQNIDIIVSGNLNDGLGLRFLGCTQNFQTVNENLSIDITHIVSGTISGQIPDHGFRISFNEIEEQDTVTRFVKRFASRHVSNRLLHPRILVSWDDTINDNSKDFYFDSSGSVFLSSFERNKFTNLTSGSALTPVVGPNCLIMRLQTGSYTKEVTGSQFLLPGVDSKGIYKATFAVPSNDPQFVLPGTSTLAQLIATSSSIDFMQQWESLDGTVIYYKDILTIKMPTRSTFKGIPLNLDFVCTNSKQTFNRHDVFRFKVFVHDKNENYKATKKPIRLQSLPIEDVYYRIVDKQTGQVYIPFLDSNNGTKLSKDSEGLFFDFPMNSLVEGRQFGIQLLVKSFDTSSIYNLEDVSFRVV